MLEEGDQDSISQEPEMSVASRKRGQFESRHADPQHQDVMELSSTTPAELDHYVDLLNEEASAWDQYRVDCEYVRGGETAILAGERDLGRIQKAELQFYSRSPH